MLARRSFLRSFVHGGLGGGTLAWSMATPASARDRLPSRADSPLVGVDPVFVDTGLTARWSAAMKQDLGWAARWSAMDTSDVLNGLEQGELDAGMFLSHPRADALDKQGLIYNRLSLARTGVLLVGPTDDEAGIRSETDPARALAQVINASNAGAARWLAPQAGSALALLADQLVHGLNARNPSASSASASHSPGKSPAYRLITQAQWLKSPPKAEKLKVWLNDPARLYLEAQVACSFRSRHAGAKLLLSWLQWPLAQSAIKASKPGWQPMKE